MTPRLDDCGLDATDEEKKNRISKTLPVVGGVAMVWRKEKHPKTPPVREEEPQTTEYHPTPSADATYASMHGYVHYNNQ